MMTFTQPQHLAVRLDRLERRWRVTVAAIAVFGLAGVTVGAASRPSSPAMLDTLRVERLVIVDRSGTERIVLTTDNDDVWIKGRRYQRRSPQTGIVLQDSTGSEIAGFGALDDGTVNVTLDQLSPQYGPRERASLYVLPSGVAGLLINDPRGTARLSLTAGNDLAAHLALRDGDGRARFTARLDSAGGGDFTILREDGSEVVSVP